MGSGYDAAATSVSVSSMSYVNDSSLSARAVASLSSTSESTSEEAACEAPYEDSNAHRPVIITAKNKAADTTSPSLDEVVVAGDERKSRLVQWFHHP